MPYTYGQFDDEIREIKELGREAVAGGVVLREVTLTTGERFAVDVDLIFASRDEAQAAAGQGARH